MPTPEAGHGEIIVVGTIRAAFFMVKAIRE
jgi:hypothetical protein